jgi:orotidine-5'-phosphate decarboxylase
MTPAKALANGATRLVIGRDLSRNGEFQKNYKRILENIMEEDIND